MTHAHAWVSDQLVTFLLVKAIAPDTKRTTSMQNNLL